MEALPFSMRTPWLSLRPYAYFHSPTQSINYQPSFMISRKKKSQQKVYNTFSEVFDVIPAWFDKKSSEFSLLDKVLNTLDKAIVNFLDPPLHKSIDPSYILSDNFAPVDELSPTECEIVHGLIPLCLDGVYMHIGPNPQFAPNGPHHYLDGDGMVHSIRLTQGRAIFCSRYVKTNKYLFEHQAKSQIVPNVISGMQCLAPFVARVALFAARVALGHYDIGKGIGVANTNLALFGGSLYALCESDLPYDIQVKDNGDVITLGQHDFNGELSLNMTAHPKIDPVTKEAFAFRYWSTRPYMTYFYFDADGNKQPDVPILSMNKPSLTHDLAITQKFAIICDIQLGADPMNLLHGHGLVSVDKTKVPRIAVIGRYAKDDSDMKWFEVPEFNVFHVVNAWDETDEDGNDVVVLVAPNILSMEHFFEQVDLIQTSMEKVTIHFGTGVVSRQTLSIDNLEFPVMNPAYVAKKNKYVYAAISEKTPIKSRMMRTIGVVKLDVTESEEYKEPYQHTVANRMYGDNCFGGEPFFVARDPDDPNSKEDDGYVVSYVHDETTGESKFLVMDAQSPCLEVVAAVKCIFVTKKDLNEM